MQNHNPAKSGDDNVWDINHWIRAVRVKKGGKSVVQRRARTKPSGRKRLKKTYWPNLPGEIRARILDFVFLGTTLRYSQNPAEAVEWKGRRGHRTLDTRNHLGHLWAPAISYAMTKGKLLDPSEALRAPLELLLSMGTTRLIPWHDSTMLFAVGQEFATKEDVTNAIIRSATIRIDSDNDVVALSQLFTAEQQHLMKTVEVSHNLPELCRHDIATMQLKLGRFRLTITHDRILHLSLRPTSEHWENSITSTSNHRETIITPSSSARIPEIDAKDDIQTLVQTFKQFDLEQEYVEGALSRVEVETMLLSGCKHDYWPRYNGLGKLVFEAVKCSIQVGMNFKVVLYENRTKPRVIAIRDAWFSTVDWCLKFAINNKELHFPQTLSKDCLELGLYDIKQRMGDWMPKRYNVLITEGLGSEATSRWCYWYEC